MLRRVFMTNPVKGILLSLYVLPVRKFFKLSDDEYINKRTFTMSREYYDELHRLLHIAKAEGYELVRTGNKNDGGYIMLDDLPGGIAYSFGIAQNVEWDRDMAERGYDVFMYDHTIDGLPEENPRYHWSKLGIGDGSGKDDRLKTLEEFISRNGHEGKRNMILKMDVEGAEWGFLESVKPETLTQFRQILFEFHGLLYPQKDGRKISDILSAFRKINETHQLLHLHPCNYAADYVSVDGRNYPAIIEASYAIRDEYKFTQDYDVNLPLEIDAPDATFLPDIELGCWNRETDGGQLMTSAVKVI